jgi:hypothetical protein
MNTCHSAEEKKAQRHIKDAVQRAKEIETIKRRHADHLKAKREHQEEMEACMEDAMAANGKK